MEQRLQTTADDSVLEITESKPSKRRLSEKRLTQQKSYLEQTIAHFQAALDEVNGFLAMIAKAKSDAARD